MFVDCPLEVLIRRDPKGLYRKALDGEIENFTGVSDPYEPPENPDIHIRTSKTSLQEALAAILEYLEKQRLVPVSFEAEEPVGEGRSQHN